MSFHHTPARLLALLAAAALTMSCIAGTEDGDDGDQGGDGQATGPVTVEFWTINLQRDYADYIQGLIDAYETEHPDVTIEWVDVPGGDETQKLLAALAGGDVPDAVNLVDIEVPQFANRLTDLSEYFSQDDLADYQDGLLDSVTRDGRLLAIPWYHGGAPIAWYDGQVLEQAGLSADDLPTTWEEALAFGEKIHDETGVYGFMSQPVSNALPSVDVLQTFGIELLNDDRTEAVFNTPEVAALWETWREAYNSGAIAPGVVTENVQNPPETVANEQAAGCAYCLPFVLLSIQNTSPDVYERLVLSKAVTGDAGIFTIPGVQTFVVPEQSTVKDQAAEFIGFVTNAENQLAFDKLVTIFPSTESTLADPFFADIEVTDLQDRSRQVVVDSVPQVRAATLGTTKDLELKDAYLARLRTFITGERPAQELLDEAAADWNDMLAD